jgi:sortase A
VETGFYLGGLALLAIYFTVRFEGERQREAGIQAFHQSATSVGPQQAAAERRVTLGSDGLGGRLEATVAAPDQALWTDKRIQEYEESLRIEADAPLAVMTIPKMNIQVPVYDGADDFNLNRGVARIEGTARVGDRGNLGIAGHRDSFFRGLKDIGIGDAIDLLTPAGTEAYAVSSIDIVDPEDVWVLQATKDKTITLVTCYPFYYVGHAPKRFIVKATAEHSLAKN